MAIVSPYDRDCPVTGATITNARNRRKTKSPSSLSSSESSRPDAADGIKPTKGITAPELKAVWQQGRKELFYPYGKTYAQTLGEQDQVGLQWEDRQYRSRCGKALGLKLHDAMNYRTRR